MPSRVIYVVNIRIAVEHEKKFNQWYDKEHIPRVLAQPGFLQVRKFRAIKNDSKEAEYFVMYELQNQEAYERYVKSEEATRLRQEFLDAYGSRTKVTRFALQETFHVLK